MLLLSAYTRFVHSIVWSLRSIRSLLVDGGWLRFVSRSSARSARQPKRYGGCNGSIDHHVRDEISGRVFHLFLLVVILLWMRVKM